MKLIGLFLLSSCIIHGESNAFGNMKGSFPSTVEDEDGDTPHWNYLDKGPKTWMKKFPFCNGKRQSPIALQTTDAVPAHSSNNIYTNNLYRKFKMDEYQMVNNGHSLQINLPSDNKYQLKKGDNAYVPVQVQLHFDPISGEGSEHTLNGRKYLGEMHILARNSRYRWRDDYMHESDGLLIIAAFVELVAKNSSFAMSLFGNAALSLVDPGQTKDIAPFPIGWLLPTKPRKNSRLGYINYHGSLTTPPCSEIVDWVVITGRTLEVSQELAKNLVKVKNDNGKKMAGNYRPTQEMNDRPTFGVKSSI